MEKQIILFDLDKTLFNPTVFFEQNLFPTLERELGVSQEKLKEISKDYRTSLPKGTAFDPEMWLNLVGQHAMVNIEQLRVIFSTATLYAQALYPEVIPTLSVLANNYVLGVFSEGVLEWQMKKISLSGLINYFDQKYISISENKLSDQVLAQIPHGALIVDDKTEVILSLKKIEDVLPVWLNRLGMESLPNVREIRDLTQLPRLAEQFTAENSQSN